MEVFFVSLRFARQYYVIGRYFFLLAMLLIVTAYVFLAFLVNFRTSYNFSTGGGGDGYNFSTVLSQRLQHRHPLLDCLYCPSSLAPYPNPPSPSTQSMADEWSDEEDSRTAQVMREQITRLGDIAERSQKSFESFIKTDDAASVPTVMKAVLACGAKEGSDEHFIATELFVKRAQREMFLHMSEASRFGWLRRKYHIKYGRQ